MDKEQGTLNLSKHLTTVLGGKIWVCFLFVWLKIYSICKNEGVKKMLSCFGTSLNTTSVEHWIESNGLLASFHDCLNFGESEADDDVFRNLLYKYAGMTSCVWPSSFRPFGRSYNLKFWSEASLS